MTPTPEFRKVYGLNFEHSADFKDHIVLDMCSKSGNISTIWTKFLALRNLEHVHERWNNLSVLESPTGNLLRIEVHVLRPCVVGEVWNPTTFMDKYDITARPVQMREIRTFFWYPRHCVVSKEELFSCRCSTTLNNGSKTLSKHVSQTQERLPNTRNNSS